ncbi:hypothetical protein HWV00_03350 [Moritella sp. 24]|uniref:hypothetical protein n=1 Tax=Moritella sp. 24 TaxID=2746230 RepID=UPI001BAA345B|nr:hypothetical protein [Moritella sp. 24]QUM75343.1 hypothetical protein HWV00_03350 [Moritella sp. 24]
MFGRNKSYDLERSRDNFEKGKSRESILANAGIAGVGTQGCIIRRGSTLGTKKSARLNARQKKLHKKGGYTKQAAYDDAKLLGVTVSDMRSDIAGYIGDSADAIVDVSKFMSGTGGAYTGGSALGVSASTTLGPLMQVHSAVVNIYEWKKNLSNAQDLPANPLLSTIDAALHENTKTAAYFKKRMGKKIAGDLFSFGGGMLSSVTHVNALGAVRHGRSDAKTIAHLVRLNEMLKKYKSKGLTVEYNLCKVIIDAKKLKVESQSAALVADMIPGNIAGGATAAISFAHGQTLNCRLSNMAIDIEKAAKRLHYRAFYEMDDDYGIAGLFGEEAVNEYASETPALDMVRELFSQIGRIEKERVLLNFAGHKLKFGGEHFRADKLMHEPAGWMTIVDKLNLI